MPNNVMNTISAEGIGELPIYSFEEGKEIFDFNKLIPMPKGLEPETDMSPVVFPQTDDPLVGFPDWYRWRVKNWGTKWNAYKCHIDEDKIAFTTAWSPPNPVIRVLAAKYPWMDFIHSYLDEGRMDAIFINVYEHGVLVESKEIFNPYYWKYKEKLASEECSLWTPNFNF